MAISTLRLTDSDLTARAREIRFTRVVAWCVHALAQLLANVVYGLGWAVGRFWLGLVIGALSFYYGFRSGTGKPIPPVQPGPPSQ